MCSSDLSKVWEWSEVHSWLRANLGISDEVEMPTHQEYATIEHMLLVRGCTDERLNFVRTLVRAEMAIESAAVRVCERVLRGPPNSMSWSREPAQVRRFELVA